MLNLRRFRLITVCLCVAVLLSGCESSFMKDTADGIRWSSVEQPEISDDLEKGKNGIPMLDVYDIADQSIHRMDLEEYVTGVVAGEMKNDWPIEALKAQAILARTFVLKFCDTKDSKYDDADISTDVAEAQAYAPQNINDRIKKAVEETQGEVMSADGDYPYAWFYAHAGGKTELPSVALDFKDTDPDYLSVVDSLDSNRAPSSVQHWKTTFTKEQLAEACAAAGLKLDDTINSVEIGQKGESGRAKTLLINDKSVSAPSVRIHIGANELKSTLLDDIQIDGNTVTFTGRGYGHGVGMSQWGAYELAERGRSAEEIIRYYFRNIDIVKLW